ncbi:MAG: glycosyltransferase family 4 protein [Thermoleophilia bacterium]
MPVIPWPASDGLRVRAFNLARELARRHEVHLFCLATMASSEEQEAGIAAAGLHLTVVLKPFLSPEFKTATYLRRLARGVPPEFILSWEADILRSLKDLHVREKFDLVQAEHLFMARFVLALDCPRLLVEHNVEGELMLALARREKMPSRWSKSISAAWAARYEKKLLRRMQAVTAVTLSDARAIRSMVPNVPVSVVENGVSCDDYAAIVAETGRPGDSLLFIGLMSYPANAEAVDWFVGKVLPLVRDEYPGTVFTVAGKEPPPRVKALDDGAGVRVLGYVEDLHRLYRNNSIMVVPLLAGGGSRLKILEAFASGTPVVSTAKGAEGLEVEAGRHLLIADTPDDFAAAVIHLRRDVDLYNRLRAEARALVEEKYDWPVLAAKLEAAMADMLAATGGKV